MNAKSEVCLAIETACGPLSCAVVRGGDVLGSRTASEPSMKAEILTPMLEALLRETGIQPRELTVVATTNGPGSYTGIRVGLAFAKGLAASTGAELRLVSLSEAVRFQAEAVPARYRSILRVGGAKVMTHCSEAGDLPIGESDIPDWIHSGPIETPVFLDSRINGPSTSYIVPITGNFATLVGRAAISEGFSPVPEEQFLLSHF